MQKAFSISLFLLFIIVATSCGNRDTANESCGNILRHAKLLRIENHNGYKLAKVLNPKDSTIVDATYILVGKDVNVPENLPKGTLLRTPIDNAVVFSSVFAGPLDELGKIDVVKGVVDACYFKQPEISAGLKSGAVADLGPISRK